MRAVQEASIIRPVNDISKKQPVNPYCGCGGALAATLLVKKTENIWK
jgi:hypothetical protein